MNIFSKQQAGPPPLAVQPERSAAIIREELAIATESISPLKAKLAAAQSELSTVQRRYDAGVQDFALGTTHREPDRGELQAAVSKADALHRITQQQERTVTHLSSELAEAELAEAVLAGRELLGPLTTAAEAELTEFTHAVSVAKDAERALFRILFDETQGLKQHLPPAVQQEATRVRHSIRSRVEEVARKFSFALNPRFETDGEVNLGVEDAQYSWRRLFGR